MNERFGMETPEFTSEYDGGFDHVKAAFWRLSNLRTNGMNGPDPIQPSTILDWIKLSGERLSRDEVKMILAMDVAYIGALHKEGEAAQYKD